MATYNGYVWIEAQIKSILFQKDVEVTLFISDDYSDDGTYRYLKALCNNYPQIHLLSRYKRFGNAAQNFFHLIRSVNFKSFDYVSLSDQDDVWINDKISRAIVLMKIQNASCYSSDVLAFWDNGKTKTIKKSQAQTEFDYLFESAGPGCTYVLTAQSMAPFKTHISQSKNDVDQVLHHDWLIYAFMRSRQFKWVIDDYLGIHYRQHSSNEMGAHVGFNASLKRVSYILGGAWLGQVRMVGNFCGKPQKQFVNRYLKWKHEQFFSLALKAHLLRRRSRDVFALFFIFLGLALKKFFTRP